MFTTRLERISVRRYSRVYCNLQFAQSARNIRPMGRRQMGYEPRLGVHASDADEALAELTADHDVDHARLGHP
jgi:hypothetical protein